MRRTAVPAPRALTIALGDVRAICSADPTTAVEGDRDRSPVT